VQAEASVIVPVYGDLADASRCLRALLAQDLDPTRFEILLVDNNPEATARPDLPAAPNLRLIHEPRPGSYAARNAGVRAAQGRYIFFTDADCMPVTGWISRGLALFAAGQGCRRVAGAVVVGPCSGRWNGWSVYDRTFNLRQDRQARRGAAITANLALDRRLFDEIGPFDDTRFSGEDMAWNRRATAAGAPLHYDVAMRVDHPARESFAACAGKVRRIAGARYAAKAGRPLARRLPRLKYLVPLPGDLLEIWRHPEPAPVRAKLAAMGCHYALGWVYNAEILRLGLGRGAPRRE
jgi:GT2 family glycosyltransferase